MEVCDQEKADLLPINSIGGCKSQGFQNIRNFRGNLMFWAETVS